MNSLYSCTLSVELTVKVLMCMHINTHNNYIYVTCRGKFIESDWENYVHSFLLYKLTITSFSQRKSFMKHGTKLNPICLHKRHLQKNQKVFIVKQLITWNVYLIIYMSYIQQWTVYEAFVGRIPYLFLFLYFHFLFVIICVSKVKAWDAIWSDIFAALWLENKVRYQKS